jgi:hypothetical protein
VYSAFTGKYGKRPRAAACRQTIPNAGRLALESLSEDFP